MSSVRPECPSVTLGVNGRLCVYGFRTFSSIQSSAEVLFLTIRKDSEEDTCGNTSCLRWSRLKATRYSQQRSETLKLSNSSSVSNPRLSWHLHSYIRETKSEKYTSRCLKARRNGSGQFSLPRWIKSKGDVFHEIYAVCGFPRVVKTYLMLKRADGSVWRFAISMVTSGMDYLNKTAIHEHAVYIYQRWHRISKTAGRTQLKKWTAVTIPASAGPEMINNSYFLIAGESHKTNGDYISGGFMFS